MRVNPKDNRWFSAKKDGFRRKIVLLFDGVFTLRGLSRRPAEYFSPVRGVVVSFRRYRRPFRRKKKKVR